MSEDRAPQNYVHHNVWSSALLISTISVIARHSWANERDLPEAASAEVLFWVALISLGFVWGALNGLCLLALRSWRYEEAGDRWSSGFWFGVAWAPFTFLITRKLFSWWGGWTWEELGGGTISILLFTLIILNGLGVWAIASWASQE